MAKALWNFLVGVILCSSGMLFNCGRSAQSYLEKGNAFYAHGQYAEASLNYRRALQKNPKFGEAFHQLGSSELKEGKLAAAFQDLALAVQLMPESETAKVDLANLALDAYQADPQHPKVLYDQMARLSDELLKHKSNSADGLRIKGYLALWDHRPEDAVALLRRADQARPKQEGTLIGLMDALYQANRQAEAEKVGLDSLSADQTGRIYEALMRLYTATGRAGETERILILRTKGHPRESKYILQLAGYYARQGKKAQMTAALEPLLQDPATFPDGHLEVGEFYTAMGAWPQAMDELKRGAAAHPKDVRYQHRIAQVLVFENKRDEALRVLDAAVKINPEKQLRTLRAAVLVENEAAARPDQGIAEFQSLVDQEPNDLLLRFLFSKAQMDSGNTAGARMQLNEIIRRNPAFIEAHLALADIALHEGQMHEALQHAQEVLAIEPNNYSAQFIRGSALLSAGSLDQAGSAFNAMLRDRPSNDIRLQLAVIEERKKNFGGAEAAFQKILEQSPREWRALAGLIQVYSAEQRIDKAFVFLEQQLQRSNGAAEVRNMLADTALAAGKYDLAIEQYRQLAARSPQSIEPQLQLAEALRRKGDWNGAAATLQNVANMHPKDARPPSMLAAVLDQANRKDEAKAQCRRALALKPNDAALMNNLADLMVETGDSLDEALKLARQAVDRAPGNSDYLDTLGWIYAKKGMSGDSVRILRKLVEQRSDNPTFSYHLGMALYQNGELVEARLQLGRALELEPSEELKHRIQQAINQLN